MDVYAEGKFVHIHDMKTYRRSDSKCPVILA